MKGKLRFYLGSLVILPMLVACSGGVNSCLDDGIAMEQVQGYLEQGKRQELINQLTIRAENGESAAQYFLGFLQWTESEELAFSWFKRSAERGCLEGMLHVAQSYSEGQGVVQDYAQSFEWYMKAAKGGDSSAAKMVAHMYRQGQGVEKDLEQARYWASQSW